MRPPSEFPAVDAAPRIRNLDVVQTLFECVPFVSLFLSLINGLQPFGERILVDIVLVVKLRIWITSDSLDSLTPGARRALCVVLEHIVSATVLLEVLQIGLNLLVNRFEGIVAGACVSERVKVWIIFGPLLSLFVFLCLGNRRKNRRSRFVRIQTRYERCVLR